MKTNLYLLIILLFSQCSTPKNDAWEVFTKCATNECIKEAIDVKDAFLNDPKTLLTQFQATYEKGEDHVIGWLYMLRDSVLINPKMGTIEERLAMQKALIDAAKPYLKDAKVHEMAESVVNELQIVDVKAGKINDPMAAANQTGDFCYQFVMNGDTTSCQITMNENNEFKGFYAWKPDGKDGTFGILTGKQSNDTLVANYKYMQEGQTSTEPLLFVKQGEMLINLVSDEFDNDGRMILTNRKKLKAGDTLKKVDCAKLDGIIKYIKEDKLSF
jgi:hypothetical protein